MDFERKNIAVILSEIGENYQSCLLSGIQKKAREYNFNIAVFSTFFTRMLGSPLNEIGESNIYALINYDLFDAFIVVPNSVEIPGIMTAIEQKLKEVGKPVIYIDSNSNEYPIINCDDALSVKNLINHLIHDHGLRKINCLTGTKGFILAEDRLRGYFEALEENGIEIDPERYAYGDFWYTSAYDYVEHILSSGKELPDAIVCGNDVMAIGVCDRLAEHGIRVPQEIVVTGYDGIDDGKVHKPQITTIEQPMRKNGAKAVEYIYELINGKSVPMKTKIPGEIVKYESCGCSQNVDEMLKIEIGSHQKMQDLNQYFLNSTFMPEELQESNNIEELFERVKGYVHLLFNKPNTFCICICDNWDILGEREFTDNPLLSGYSSRVKCFLRYSSNNTLKELKEFQVSQMFPPLFDEKMPPNLYSFTPLNFRDLTFGYTVINYIEDDTFPDIMLRNWVRTLTNSLEHIRSKQHLQWALKRLERISEIDSLTGVYNRYGYENRINALFEKCRHETKDFLLVMGDLDCLKLINDNFGHCEGDNAIRIIAKAFQNSFTEDEVCARIGGDEFILIAGGYFEEQRVKSYEERISEYLDHYNKNSPKPYLIVASVGVYCARVKPDSELKDWISSADEHMYKNKKNKQKKYRKDD